jgi:LEA14-like dessication related protein
MELFLIYVWLKLDSVGVVLIAATVVLAVVAPMMFMFGNMEDSEVALKWGRRGLIALGLVVAAKVIFPTSTDVAVLVGASYGLDLAKSAEGQKAWTLIRGKANELLDEELKKLSPPAK